MRPIKEIMSHTLTDFEDIAKRRETDIIEFAKNNKNIEEKLEQIQNCNKILRKSYDDVYEKMLILLFVDKFLMIWDVERDLYDLY